MISSKGWWKGTAAMAIATPRRYKRLLTPASVPNLSRLPLGSFGDRSCLLSTLGRNKNLFIMIRLERGRYAAHHLRFAPARARVGEIGWWRSYDGTAQAAPHASHHRG